MTNEVKGGGSYELSTDINVITAEINAYQRVAGEAIFEIGRRLLGVKYDPTKYGLPAGKDKEGKTIVARGAWGEWLTDMDIPLNTANRFMLVTTELGSKSSTSTNKGLSALYEIATIPEESRTDPHTIPSTGVTKTVDEMTVRELREVKAELKKTQAERDAERKSREQAEAQAKTSQRSEEILRSQLDEFEDGIPDVEIRTEYVEVPDAEAARKAQRYEELFGDISLYDGQATRVSNGDAITFTVHEFGEDVRKFAEKYGHLTHFTREFNEMIPEGKQVYGEAINDMYRLLGAIERSMDVSKSTIING